MDEIILDEKKYISTKAAAKVTGYAKDYVGQLCREGRVPARLVGRSWYVLESAIRDHRFGSAAAEADAATEDLTAVGTESASVPTWQSPRYEASHEPVLPTIAEPERAWDAWYDLVSERGASAHGSHVSTEQDEIAREMVVAAEMDAGGTVPEDVPTVEDLPARLLVQRGIEVEPEEGESEDERLEVVSGTGSARGAQGALLLSIRLVGGTAALVAVIVAILGSGYLDHLLPDDSRIEAISGVVLYSSR